MKEEHELAKGGNEELNIRIIVEITENEHRTVNLHKHEVTGREIKEAAQLPLEVELAVRSEGEVDRVTNHEPIAIEDGERFFVVHNELCIHYTLDDEPQSTTKRILTPVQIMEDAKPEAIDPKTHYLIRIIRHKKESFKEAPEEPIHMHNRMVFVTNFIGPMPVSNR
jgi:hypothetical protein